MDAGAHSEGYRIARDHYASASSLIDARLCGPLLGLDRVALGEIVNAIEATYSTHLIRPRRRSPRLGPAPAPFDGTEISFIWRRRNPQDTVTIDAVLEEVLRLRKERVLR
jgi:hypothetical protein